jgi:hypothetical protein
VDFQKVIPVASALPNRVQKRNAIDLLVLFYAGFDFNLLAMLLHSLVLSLNFVTTQAEE